MNDISLWIIVPCYNEEEAITESSKLLLDKIKNLENKELINRNFSSMMVQRIKHGNSY